MAELNRRCPEARRLPPDVRAMFIRGARAARNPDFAVIKGWAFVEGRWPGKYAPKLDVTRRVTPP